MTHPPVSFTSRPLRFLSAPRFIEGVYAARASLWLDFGVAALAVRSNCYSYRKASIGSR